ncbi:MAG TPA: host attachment family protein [Candidatus Cybelea sp.]|nr:host attachment family protein [Candidatus Cybelea sp.]
MPAKRKRTWIVVADGARARFFRENDERTGLVPALASDMVGEEVHGRSADLKSDHPGRAFASAGGGTRHSYEPKHDYHKFEKHKFAAEVARMLEQACVAGQFDSLVLVAPRRSLGELRTLLTKKVQEKVAEELPKDLTKRSAATVWKHVLPSLKPPAAK